MEGVKDDMEPERLWLLLDSSGVWAVAKASREVPICKTISIFQAGRSLDMNVMDTKSRSMSLRKQERRYMSS